MKACNSIILEEDDIEGLQSISEQLISLYPGQYNDSSWGFKVEITHDGKFQVREYYEEWVFSKDSKMIFHSKLHAQFEDEEMANSYIKLLNFLSDLNYQ